MPEIVTISVSMPAEMQRMIMEQIQARFFGNISEYFRYLVREDLQRSGGPLARPSPALPSTVLSLHNASPSVLRQASDADLVAFADQLAGSDPAAPRRRLRERVAEHVREELDQRQIPVPKGLLTAIVGVRGLGQPLADPDKAAIEQLGGLIRLYERPGPWVFDEGSLRKFQTRHSVKEIELVRDLWSRGSAEWDGADALVRLLKGEGSPKQRAEWFGLITERLLMRIRMEVLLRRRDSPPEDDAGPAAVPRPRPPRPKPDAARARPPKREDR